MDNEILSDILNELKKMNTELEIVNDKLGDVVSESFSTNLHLKELTACTEANGPEKRSLKINGKVIIEAFNRSSNKLSQNEIIDKFKDENQLFDL